jgi:F-type H+-transporting ATPase subunit gamma
LLCTTDRGLCGGFNSHLITKAQKFAKEKSEQGVELSFTAFGKKGRDFCRKSHKKIADQYLGVVGANFGFNVASTAGQTLIGNFLKETYDEVYIIYSEFAGMSRQIPTIQQILPIPPIEISDEIEDDKEASFVAEHICEPSADELLGDMLPRNVFVQIYKALLETSTSEHAARMMAMDNATKACDDMVDNLTLAYNKARQAAVTTELMDIVGGAEALKG